MPREGDLVRDLSRPDAYPEPRPRSVELAQTHISWVFLTEDGAWKVKRPVNFGFVDFSTAERRRYFCEEEVRLNRRLAPDVYVGVVPVRLGTGGFAFTGDGEIVDHAVRMRRLPESSSARAVLGRGELSPEHLARLAGCLARFYVRAREMREWGAPTSIASNVEENLASLHTFVGRLLGRPRFEEVAAAQRRDLLRFDTRLRARQDGGRVREGHGDLRLEHVFFLEAPPADPLIIDTVEFSERLRSGDAALDVAFFAMELEAAGRADLAEYFSYRFARETDDYDFYPLLDFYVVYRALVRAKVACLLAADPGTPVEKARRKEEEAVQLLGLASARAAARPRPMLIAVGGLVGSGKSTLAEAMARGLGLPVISSDRVRKSLGGVSAMDRRSPALYTDAWTAATYEEVLRRADVVLESGRGVILDATFSRREWRRRARALGAARGAGFIFVEATCDEAALRARLRERAKGQSESDADLSVLDRTRAAYERPDEVPAEERLVVDTARDGAELAAELTRRIQSRTAPIRG